MADLNPSAPPKKIVDNKAQVVLDYGMRNWTNTLISLSLIEYEMPPQMFPLSQYHMFLNNLNLWWENNVPLDEYNIELFDRTVPETHKNVNTDYLNLLVELIYQIILSFLRNLNHMNVSNSKAMVARIIKVFLLCPIEEVPVHTVKRLNNYRHVIATTISKLNIFHVDPEFKNEESSIQLKNFLELHSKERFYYEMTLFLNNLHLSYNQHQIGLDKMIIAYNKKHKKRKRESSGGKKRKKARKNDSEDSGGEIKRKRIKWTEEESNALEEGVKTFGLGNWSKILEEYKSKFHKNRRTRDLRVKWRYISKKIQDGQSENPSQSTDNENNQSQINISQDNENNHTDIKEDQVDLNDSEESQKLFAKSQDMNTQDQENTTNQDQNPYSQIQIIQEFSDDENKDI